MKNHRRGNLEDFSDGSGGCVFISGVGTGGTLTGVTRYIKGTKGKMGILSPLR